MTDSGYNYFVTAAVIAAELHKASKIAKQLSITASNARAVALRAGEGAAGFRPLTEFIDRLANLTVSSSNNINQLAGVLSRTAADKYRADHAIARFNSVYKRSHDSIHISSLDKSYQRTQEHREVLLNNYVTQQSSLLTELDELKGELRTAVILATLSRVEASQAGDLYQSALNNVAENVESSANGIKAHIQTAFSLVSYLKQD